jgi:predicted metal-dependent HD superfamily phosphohydrolase
MLASVGIARNEVWLAVLYHDAVYVPGRSDNEAASAASPSSTSNADGRRRAIDSRRLSQT